MSKAQAIRKLKALGVIITDSNKGRPTVWAQVKGEPCPGLFHPVDLLLELHGKGYR